jgi:hypothetical protein
MLTTHLNTWKTLCEHSGSLGAYGNGEKYEGGRVLFIGPEKKRTSDQGAYVWWFLSSGSMVASYVKVLSKGYLKSSVHSVIPRTTGGPPVRLHYKQ